MISNKIQNEINVKNADYRLSSANDIIQSASSILAGSGSSPDDYYFSKESLNNYNGCRKIQNEMLLMININEKPIKKALNDAATVYRELKTDIMLISHGKLYNFNISKT